MAFDPQEAIGEVEAALAAGTFRLTDVLNDTDELKRLAKLEYLHGRGPNRRSKPVYVTIDVTREIVKNEARPLKVGRKTRFIGGSEKMPFMPSPAGPIPLRHVTAVGRHTMTTEEAVWYLWNYGEDTLRVMIKGEAVRKAWCREVSPEAPDSADPKRGKRISPPHAAASAAG